MVLLFIVKLTHANIPANSRSRSVVLKFQDAPASPGKLVKTQTAGPTIRVSDSVSLGWSLGMCSSDRVTLGAAAASPRTTL